VSENLADTSKGVRGVIIAHEVDKALRYAVHGLPNVSVLTYTVDFELHPFDKSHYIGSSPAAH